MVVNMLQNLSHRYSSHYRIIKCACFELIYYVINLLISEFDYVFLHIYYKFESINVSFQKKKEKKKKKNLFEK